MSRQLPPCPAKGCGHKVVPRLSAQPKLHVASAFLRTEIEQSHLNLANSDRFHVYT